MLDTTDAVGPPLARGGGIASEDAPERGAVSAGSAGVEAVYAREHARLAALGAMLTGDAAAGEDLAHDVFVDALRRTREDPSYLREPAWPWLRVALARRAMRRGRRLTGELRRLALLGRSAEPAAWSADTVDCLRALASLPARMRACAVLFYWQDMSTADVARTLGLSHRTVENHLRRARACLAEKLRVAIPGEH